MFRKIMVPVDPGAPEVAGKALEIGKWMAAQCGAEILLISIAERPDSEEAEAEAEARLQAMVDAEKGDLKMDGVLTLGGRVADEIRYAAEEMGVDLIVMASHEPRISDLLFGSKSAQVALHTHCCVLVVR